MVQATEDKDYIYCPQCKKLAETTHARAVVCNFLGITLGYHLFCENCHQVTFLRFMGHPPLLDLHSLGIAIWNLPEA